MEIGIVQVEGIAKRTGSLGETGIARWDSSRGQGVIQGERIAPENRDSSRGMEQLKGMGIAHDYRKSSRGYKR
jgi:hypothetical protein